MPISPKRKKLVRPKRVGYKHPPCAGEPFFTFKPDPPKRFRWIRKLFCRILRCDDKILNEGYPSYNKYYHIHSQCQRCGNETVLIDKDMPLRPKRYPMSYTVITFDKQGEIGNER